MWVAMIDNCSAWRGCWRMQSEEEALQAAGRTGRRGREQLSVKDVLLALGGGPHHFPHYPNWAQQCLVTFIIIDHAYANERVCAHELSVRRLRRRGNVGATARPLLPRSYRQTSAAAAFRLQLVHRHPGTEQRPPFTSSVCSSGSLCTVLENDSFVVP